MDKNWMHKSRLSQEYLDGVEEFLNFAFDNSSQDDKIICPCIKCVNIQWQTRQIVLEHLVCDGILQGYKCWFFHGERVPSPTPKARNTFIGPSSSVSHDQSSHVRPDNMEELLQDAFNMHHVDNDGLPSSSDEFNVEVSDGGETLRGVVDEQPSKEAAKFYKLLEIDEDMQIVETEILTEVIGKERCGRVRGVGLGPTPKSYYGRTTSRNSTTSSNQSNEFVERFHQMEQEMKQMKEERDQERAQRDQERAQREEERAQYNALLGFLQNQFPGVTIPGVNAIGSTSQSQNQFLGDQ